MKMTRIIAAILSLLCSINAYCCSQTPTPNVETAFQESKAVYLAVAKSIKLITQHNEKFTWVEQEVIFEVLQTWKGNYKVGEKIKYNTVVSSGCGVSVDNYDHWFQEEPFTEKLEPVYPKLSGIWLIYSSEANERSLWATGRTKPLEFGGAEDLQKLYALASKKHY